MKNRIFTGAAVALITPLHDDGSVNFAKLDELVEMQIAGHTDAIVACGTTGESSTLTHEEHCQVIRRVIDRTHGRIPVLAGTGSNHTEYAVTLSQEAQRLGADGVLVVTPYYNKASQTGLIRHYTTIADSIDIPLLIYDIPSRTGCKIATETFLALSHHHNIVGVKAASGDFSALASLRAACGDDLDVYSGNDDQITPLLSLGGIGVISVLSNILPKETHEICSSYLAGDVKRSAELQLKYLDLIHMLFVDVNPIAVKEAMNLMGMQVGGWRLPLCELDAKKHEQLKNCLKRYHLI